MSITISPQRRRRALAALGAAALALTSALVFALLPGCARRAAISAEPPARVAATTAIAALENVPRLVSAPGAVEAAARAEVSTRMMGWVRRVRVREGDVVRAGAPLVSIDDADLQARREQVEAQIEEARAAATNAEKTAARFEKLYAEKAVSGQQLDDVRTGRDRAQAGLKAALAGRNEVDTNLRYLDVTAPIAGLVVRKLVEPGNMANPGMPLVVLEQTDRMKIVARLGEKDVGAVAAGDSVTVEIPSLPGADRRAVIDRVIPAADPGTRTFAIEAYVPNADGRLKSGLFARVLVPTGSRQAIVIPLAAVVERGQLRGVFVVAPDGAAALRWVRLGPPAGDGVEVLAGLDGGETVVVRPERPLVEGDRVVAR